MALPIQNDILIIGRFAKPATETSGIENIYNSVQDFVRVRDNGNLVFREWLEMEEGLAYAGRTGWGVACFAGCQEKRLCDSLLVACRLTSAVTSLKQEQLGRCGGVRFQLANSKIGKIEFLSGAPYARSPTNHPLAR